MATTDGQEPLTGLAVLLTRPHDRVALLDVSSPQHQEFFSVAEGDRSLAVMVLDVTNANHPEPRVYVVEKPPGWRIDSDAEDLLLRLWRAELPG